MLTLAALVEQYLDPARDLVLALEKLRSLVARAVRGLRGRRFG
jgi:hypothetical protein